MEQRLTKLWYRADAGPSLLQPLSWLYDVVIRSRRKAFSHGWLETHRVGRPVIVVGNLTVGGTGKTPLVIWLARQLTAQGLQVGIVSRGYGSRSGEKPRVVSGESSWQDVGDEPLLISRRTGCVTIVGRDRVAAARALVERHVDVIIADDGLQHLRLGRDCEIVVIDGARGFGNGRMLPAGPLREPVSRASQADLLVVNGAVEHSSLTRVGVPIERAARMTLMPGRAVRVDGQGSRPLEDFRSGPVHAMAGIGNPERFFRDLRNQGLETIEHAFPDHHPFTATDLSFGDALPVLMTEKDAVKCAPFAAPGWWLVPTEAVFPQAQARELLDGVLRKIGPLQSLTEVGS
ncbi:MAG TPA: tetraacyldisaccharide 4'-kinase [Steroidobacteraceae bacterium]